MTAPLPTVFVTSSETSPPPKEETEPLARDEAPAGEPTERDGAAPDANPEVWRESSLALNTGLQVTDFSDTLPADQFDELFKP